jgi:uncharacterized protein
VSAEYFDVVVIGAGPGGMLAARSLAGSALKVLVIDAGRTYRQRACPVDRMRQCHGCGGICNVISGFGGSIHYGDGVKLSRFPSGRRLAELLGAERAEQLADEALGSLFEPQPMFRNAQASRTPFTIKDYPVASLRADEVRVMITRLHQHIAYAPNIALRLGTHVLELAESGNCFELETRTHRGEHRQIHAGNVIAAVGRRGQQWWHHTSRALGLSLTPPVPSVGVRFEAPTRLLLGGSQIHEDFKTTATRHGVKVKTFCYCVGAGGGRVKFTDYGEHTLLDGHVIAEEGHSEIGNFALLAQLRDELGAARDVQWVRQHILVPYRALRTDRPGKPVLQWYPDFRERAMTCATLAEFTSRAGHPPSLRDYEMANLALILPADVHSAFVAVFEELISYFTSSRFTTAVGAQVGVIGLELENLWDEMLLTPAMQTTLPGLYAVGDCAGLAQGILQAAVGGLAAAQHILAASPSPRTGAAL